MHTLTVYRRVYRATGDTRAAMVAAAQAHAALALRDDAESAAWDALTAHHARHEDAVDHTPLRLLSPDDLQHLPLAEPLIDSVLREGELGLLVGAAKTKKTWIALDLCLSCTTGTLWMQGMAVQPCPVLYVDAEASPAVVGDRLRMLSIDRHARAEHDLRILATRGQAPRSIGAACEMLANGIAQSGARLAVVDTLSAYFPMENENDNAEATAVMSQIVHVCEEMQCAILLVHHTPKGGGAGRAAIDAAAGAGAFTRRVDTALAVREEDGEIYMDVRARSFAGVNRGAITFSATTMQPRVESAPDTFTPIKSRRAANVLAK